MRHWLRLLGCSLLLSGWFAAPANAQAPAATPAPRAAQSAGLRRDTPPRPYTTVRRDRYPYGANYYDNSRGGYRNPGGVGRYAEYYPPGDVFQNAGRNPVPVATFNGSSGVPTMEEQIAAQSLGVQKYNAIQQSINSYARPAYGYGYGFGFGGGFY